MTIDARSGWEDVQNVVLDRIRSRQWKPGELIPNEADLAEEFGCARATVNRALRAVAEQGFIDRKRKAGTRVATHPVRKATLSIPIIRHEIENMGSAYSYELIELNREKPPEQIAGLMKISQETDLLHITARHLADGDPYAFEDRWINQHAIPDAKTADFETENANEWLVRNAPYTSGSISFFAVPASETHSTLLNAEIDSALFSLERQTWNKSKAITFVNLVYSPGYRLQTQI